MYADGHFESNTQTPLIQMLMFFFFLSSFPGSPNKTKKQIQVASANFATTVLVPVNWMIGKQDTKQSVANYYGNTTKH
jgi:hypothetical protein